MLQSKFLWLFRLAATAASATASVTEEYFYGKNGLSKLHINKVFADKNCGCTGSWDHTEFAEISRYFGAKLDEIVPKKTTTARGHKDASPLSIGTNTYTLSLDYSSGYRRASSSSAAVWSRLISEMLLITNHTLNRSILIGEYINDLGGSHNLTLTVYGDKSCVNVFDPCVKSEPQEVKHSLAARDAANVGRAIDWSDKEAVLKHIKLDIYNTSSLDDAIMNNKTLPPHIYHEDIHMVIDTSTITRRSHDDSKLQERQWDCLPYHFDSFSGEGAWAAWGDWLPISSCLWTGLNPSGGSQSFNIGFSMAYAESWQWGWKGLESAFSASFTFTISETYSESFTYTCNVPGKSVGQIWAQQWVGAGYLYKRTCSRSNVCHERLNCGNREGPNYVAAPARGVHALGCSTGAENMACAAYQNNWIAYSVWSHTPAHST